ncbi:MAG: hypothetical protein MK212_02195 [Saprospiraceae bacterium]|nr:hypothetical protein [Saprospiraceae bacterium]
MNKLSFLLVFALFANISFAQKTLVKSFDMKEFKDDLGTSKVDAINFKFANADKVTSEFWDNDDGLMRVELEIKTNMPTSIMEQLVKVGRYGMEGNLENGEFAINIPNLEKAVTIKGIDLEEEIIVHAMTPDMYILDNGVLKKDPEMVLAMADRTQGRSTAAELKTIHNNIVVKALAKENITIKFTQIGDLEIDTEALENGDIIIDGKPLEFK